MAVADQDPEERAIFGLHEDDITAMSEEKARRALTVVT